ncbi:MAG TPA: cytochrome ubiquinol oxidase subunit I [Kouleothrix sp.]|uniref:cytochrome ubiquinol oxidase subunit I n=1 Tax=Kouleothrix sp. TaxID=2779161 RepID=UPI002B85A43A|nr:cytochrome ubiquinol oxidase subunit I [Kouleothrix sp.]HRC76139.1 cytochrome ubiquinol oxidase subunit I [Kouleothrix sp.]
MSDLLAARSQMAMSLAFHIIFAAVGIGMPLLMVVAEGLWLRTRDETYLTLAKRWAKGTAILFAVGAVSGTVLSFELGLLWPGFMRFAGPIIGMPFSLEGFAFFTEAIFLGVYLYGWKRVSPRVHWLAGALTAISGAISGVFVVMANAWMNTPTGFRMQGGQPADIDPVAAMFNPSWFQQTLHMTIAAYLATAAAVAGIHAFMLLRHPADRFHRRALGIALWVLAISAVLQPISGDHSAKVVAKTQPAKLAALEGQFRTERGAPLRIGGLPDPASETTRYALEIPRGLSFLAHGDFDAEVVGLDQFKPEDRPNPVVVHLAFQVMVAAGMALMGLGLLCALLAWRRRGLPRQRWLLWLIVLGGPLGFVAIEAGWVVTEVGRQPWVIYGLVRTADAVTPMPGLAVTFTTFTILYLFLAAVVAWLMWTQIINAPHAEGHGQHEEAGHAIA